MPKRANKVWSKTYIKYESNGHKNKNLSLDDCLN